MALFSLILCLSVTIVVSHSKMLQEYQWNCTPSCHNSHPRSQLQYQWNEKQVAKLTQLTWFTQQLSYDRVYQRLCYSCSSYVTYLESSDPPDPPPLSLALVLDSHCTALPSWEVNSERTNYSCHSLALACSVSPSFSRVWNDSNMALTPLNFSSGLLLEKSKLEHNNPQIKEGLNRFPHIYPSSKL